MEPLTARPWLAALVLVALAHAVAALACLGWLATSATPIDGVHPAVKPLRYALSIAVLLGSVAVVLRGQAGADGARAAIAWTLVASMVVEMVIIVAQAARGRPSHFNLSTPLDAALWRLMAGAIVVGVVALLALALLATVRPLVWSPLVATAVRLGLWLLLLVAVSGFAMGGRGSHAVGAGDLRVPHFFALHGLQALPLLALALEWMPLGSRLRWAGLAVGAALWTTVAVGTLAQALAGQAAPSWLP